MRSFDTLAILCKLESEYAADAAPAALDAIVTTNVTHTPLEGDEVSRDLILPYLGNQGIILTGKYSRLEFEIEIAGAGTAGGIPKYSPIMRLCGMAETVTATKNVTYSIVEKNRESGSIYFVQDGVRHVMLGCRANVSLTMAPKAIPRWRFSITGLLGTITDVTDMPAFSLTGWTAPVEVSKANTQLTLHGWPAVAESVSIDLGNTVTPRFLIGDERVAVTGRKSTGSAVVEARALETINWFDRAQKRTRGALTLIHGTAAGNIVEIAAPAVEIGKITSGQTDKVLNYTLPLSLCPVTGRDELRFIIR